ncbi:hypothetical protein FRC12_023500, partial [Ceratobasidium sp. 428]
MPSAKRDAKGPSQGCVTTAPFSVFCFARAAALCIFDRNSWRTGCLPSSPPPATSMMTFLMFSLIITVLKTTLAAPIPDVPTSVLTTDQINLVRSRLVEGSQASWELGTSTQALLEYDYPALSVYGSLALNLPNPPNATLTPGLIYSVTDRLIQTRNPAVEAFVYDSSVGDPASIGVAVLVANFTGATGGDYNTAIQQQLDYLMNKAPRNVDGAISHRSEQIQLWSDNLSMVPPFLAYYGALHNNPTVVAEAFNQ